MSTEQIQASIPEAPVSKHASIHPLSPLTSLEITTVAALIQALYPADIKLQFKFLTLEEPEKALLAPYLDAEAAGAKAGGLLDRRALVSYYIRNTASTLHRISIACKLTVLRTNSTKRSSTSHEGRLRAMFDWDQTSMEVQMEKKSLQLRRLL
jgi:Cu2+-containing amine oxidase